MFDFPSSPSLDQIYTSGGVSYRYNGYGWVITGSSTGTGVIIASDTPPSPVADNTLWFETDSSMLWLRYNDTNSVQWVSIGGPPGPPGADPSGLFLPLIGGTLSGGLTIAPVSTHSALTLNKPVTAGTANIIWGQRNSISRWNIDIGNATAESGSNVGSDFAVNRWSDTGVFLGAPLTIIRSNGNVFTGGFLGVNGGTGSVDVALSVRHTHSSVTYYWEQAQAEFQDSRSQSAMVGGLIVFSGNYINAGGYAVMGGIGASKLNSASGDPAAALNLWSRIGPINFYSNRSDIAGAPAMSLGTDGRLRMYNGIIWADSGYPIINGGAADLAFQLGASNPGYFYWYNREGAVIGKCYGYDGKWYNIQASWTAISDRSTKENIQPYPRGLKEIIELQPVYFTYKSGIDPFEGNLHFGLIAQDVQPHFPELVGETDVEMAGEQQTVMTLEPSNLIYACLNAIKELSAEVESLKQQIGAV